MKFILVRMSVKLMLILFYQFLCDNSIILLRNIFILLIVVISLLLASILYSLCFVIGLLIGLFTIFTCIWYCYLLELFYSIWINALFHQCSTIYPSILPTPLLFLFGHSTLSIEPCSIFVADQCLISICVLYQFNPNFLVTFITKIGLFS